MAYPAVYDIRDAYVYSMYPVFIILLEDKVGNQGPHPMTEQWRKGMRSMRTERYQEHFRKNWKFSLAAVVLDHDVVRSWTALGLTVPKISTLGLQGDTEILS